MNFKEWPLKNQILSALLGVNLVFIAAAGFYFYNSQKTDVMRGVDEQLKVAAAAVPFILPDYFVDSLRGPRSLNIQRHARNTRLLSRYAEENGLSSLYTVMRDGERTVVIAASEKPEDLKRGIISPFYREYEGPSAMRRALDGSAYFQSFKTDEGGYRAYFLPFKTMTGSIYVAGAEVPLAYAESRLSRTLGVTIFLALLIFLAMSGVVYYMLDRITEPLSDLSYYMRLMADNDFALDPESIDNVKAMASATDGEVSQLSHSFVDMHGLLQEYMGRLRETTAAKDQVEGELVLAKKIQASMLPGKLDAKGVSVAALMEPAKTVGGDLYDYMPLEGNRLYFAVGDVSGKGAPAAMLMSKAQALLRAFASEGLPPNEILNRASAMLCQTGTDDMFITVFCGVLDLGTGELSYSNAGHDSPAILSTDAPVFIPIQKQPALCLDADFRYELEKVTLSPKDTLFVYTDGITEAVNEGGRFFGRARLEKSLKASSALEFSPDLVISRLREALREFAGKAPQHDDMAMLAVQYLGAGAVPEAEKQSEPAPVPAKAPKARAAKKISAPEPKPEATPEPESPVPVPEPVPAAVSKTEARPAGEDDALFGAEDESVPVEESFVETHAAALESGEESDFRVSSYAQSLELEADVRRVESLKAFVREQSEEAGLMEDTSAQLVSASEELFSGICASGRGRKTVKSLSVSYDLTDDGVKVSFAWSGSSEAPFAKQGGFGSQLASRMADKYSFRSTAEGAQAVLAKKFGSAA